jgi:hypothetical protein
VQIETDTARVDDRDPGFIGTVWVDHDGAHGLGQESVDTPRAVELSARHAVVLRRAPIQSGQVEFIAKGGNLGRGAQARRSVEVGLVCLRAKRVELESQSVPVKVAASIRPDRRSVIRRLTDGMGGCTARGRTIIGTVGLVETHHGEPTKSLAVSARLESRASLVIHLEVSDVAVSTKELDRSAWVNLADGIVDVAKGSRTGLLECSIVTDDEEEIYRVSGADGIDEPGLVDHGLGWNNLGDIGFALHVNRLASKSKIRPARIYYQ